MLTYVRLSQQREKASQEKWDRRFLEMAKLVSTFSKDPSTQCGAVITKGRFVWSIGFNGFPSKMVDLPEAYANREEKYSRVVHAEVNAIITAHRDLHGTTLYTYPFGCCDRCAVQVIQSGVGRVCFPALPADKIERWGKAVDRSKEYFRDCGVEVTEVANVA
jgi:dCMP deaminase